MRRSSRGAARGLRWSRMRERGQEVARLVESNRSGVAIDAIGGCPADIAAPLSHVVERPRQILVLPGRQLIAAHRRSASGIEQLTAVRSEEHTSELQSRLHLVCRLLLEKKKNK